MRLKANIEEMRIEAAKRAKIAKEQGNAELMEYCYGVLQALTWVQDKKNEETHLFYKD